MRSIPPASRHVDVPKARMPVASVIIQFHIKTNSIVIIVNYNNSSISESSSSNSDGLEVGSLYFPMPNVTFILKDTSKGLLERPIITFQALNIHTKSTSNKIFEDQHGIYTIENTTRPQWFTIDYQGRINLTNTAIKFLSDHSESHGMYNFFNPWLWFNFFKFIWVWKNWIPRFTLYFFTQDFY